MFIDILFFQSPLLGDSRFNPKEFSPRLQSQRPTKLDFLSTFREFDYSESDIARYSGVSIRRAQRELPKLECLKLIKMTRTSGKSKMYRMDAESQTGVLASKFVLALASIEVDSVMARSHLINGTAV